MKTHNLYILITGSVVFLIALILISFTLSKRIVNNSVVEKQTVPQPTITPISLTIFNPKAVSQIPTLSPDKGLGIDTDSQVVKSSKYEIKKLSPYLPLSTELAINKTPVSIVINSLDLQDNPWTLYIQIYGVDYRISKSDPLYENERATFREAAQYVLNWIKEKQVNPDNIIIQWGDREFIEDRAQEWL